jgi:ELWxxDGT repeat protein
MEDQTMDLHRRRKAKGGSSSGTSFRQRFAIRPCVELLEDRTVLSAGLVTDINLQPQSSNPTSLVDANGTAFFVATDALHGAELWKSDGTAGGTQLLKDINPSGNSSNITYLTAVGSRVFFNADDGVHGLELWTSDGTAAGTHLVESNLPGQFQRRSLLCSLGRQHGEPALEE